MTVTDTHNLQAVLAEVFTFSPDDLAANRQGRLSAAQRERITRKHAGNVRAAWVIFAIVFGLGFVGFSAEMIRTANFTLNTILTYAALTAFFALIVWAYTTYDGRRMNRTLQEAHPQRVEGVIQLIVERSERTQVRYFCIDGQRFRIDAYSHFVALQEADAAGQEAIAYLSVPWRSVLSVELST